MTEDEELTEREKQVLENLIGYIEEGHTSWAATEECVTLFLKERKWLLSEIEDWKAAAIVEKN